MPETTPDAMPGATPARGAPDAEARSEDEHHLDSVIEAYGVIGVPQPELDDLALLATQLCHTPAAAINLMQSGTQATIAAYGVDTEVCARTDSMCNAIIDEDHPIQVRDASQDERWADNPYVNGERQSFRFYCAHHLTTPEGLVIGTMCVFDPEPRDPDDAANLHLEQLASRVVGFLELKVRTRELHEAVQALTATQQELERSNERLRLFAAQVAHDLRGPMTSVGASLQMLAEDGVTSGESEWLLQRAAGSVGRMSDLVQSMFTLASVGGRPDAERVDLSEVVDQVTADLATELEGVSLRHGDLPVVRGSATQWRVVLQNLVANAVKFSNQREPVIEVTGSTDPDGWTLEVGDNGPGVPAEDRERVFGLLTQGDASRDGMGLGLATCWQVVRAHGGTISLHDTPAGGALVRIRVPHKHPAVVALDD